MSGDEKYQNCKHKSSTPQTIIVTRCPCAGGNYTKENVYSCGRTNISDVQPAICESCPYFEQKEIAE